MKERPAEKHLQLLTWDTNYFGMKMGEFKLPEESEELLSQTELRELLNTADEAGYRFLLCQLKLTEQTMFNVLLNLGARLGDILVTLEQKISLNPPQAIFKGIEFKEAELITKAQTADLAELRLLAGESFAYSRFFQDQQFESLDVRGMYLAWLDEILAGQAEIAVIKEAQGLQGFITLEAVNESVAKIGLLAVKAEARGKGYGQALLNWSQQTAIKTGFTSIEVGTQLMNYPALRLYEKSGFQIRQAKYRLHLWLENLNW